MSNFSKFSLLSWGKQTPVGRRMDLIAHVSDIICRHGFDVVKDSVYLSFCRWKNKALPLDALPLQLWFTVLKFLVRVSGESNSYTTTALSSSIIHWSNDRAATKLQKKVEALSLKWIKQAFVSSYHPPLCLSLCLPVFQHISPHLSLCISFSGCLSSRKCVTPVCVSTCPLTHLSNSVPVFVLGCVYLAAFISLSVSVQPDLTVVSALFQSVTC